MYIVFLFLFVCSSICLFSICLIFYPQLVIEQNFMKSLLHCLLHLWFSILIQMILGYPSDKTWTLVFFVWRSKVYHYIVLWELYVSCDFMRWMLMQRVRLVIVLLCFDEICTNKVFGFIGTTSSFCYFLSIWVQ